MKIMSFVFTYAHCSQGTGKPYILIAIMRIADG